MNNKKLIVIIIASLVGIIIIAFLFIKFTTATINVTTQENAKIYSKQGTVEFKEVGRGKATISTRESSQVIIEARLNGQVVQKPVTPQKNKSITVDLQFKPLVEAKYFAPGPLIYPYIENGFIYGINPNTNGLSVSAIEGNTNSEPTLPLLPFMKQVFWTSSNNFTYVTLGRGAGFVRNNQIEEGNYSNNVAMAKSDSNNYILLNKNGYYFSPQFNLGKVTKLADIPNNSSPSVFADNNYLYAVSLIYNESKDEGDVEPTGKETNLLIFDTNGNKIKETKLALTQEVNKVVSINKSKIAILSSDGIFILDLGTNNIQVKSFSFGDVQDMVIYKDRLILMGSDGLWQYNYDSDEYYKVATYPENQEYTPGSLVVLNKNLYFSTSVTKEALLKDKALIIRSGVYKIEF